MNDKELFEKLANIVDDYVNQVREELLERWKNWKIDLSKAGDV